jgi:hypothetical protein
VPSRQATRARPLNRRHASIVCSRRSRVFASILVSALALGALALNAAAVTAPSSKVSQISLAASPSLVSTGSSVTLTGALSSTAGAQPNGAHPAMAGVHLVLFHRLVPNRAFTEVGTLQTQAGGSFAVDPASMEGPITTNRRWYIQAIGPNGQIIARSRFVKVRVLAALTVDPAPGSILTGQATTFTGTISPAHTDERVALQRLEGGHWVPLEHTVATVTNGGFSITHTFGEASRRGPAMLRICFPGDALNVRNCTTPFAVTIQRPVRPERVRHQGKPRHKREVKQLARQHRQEARQKRIQEREERKHKREEERRQRQENRQKRLLARQERHKHRHNRAAHR